MGNFCSDVEVSPEANLSLKPGERESKECHRPKVEIAEESSAMNNIGMKGMSNESKLPPYTPGIPHRDSFIRYPEFPVLRFKEDNSTFKGQIKLGKKHGFGLEIKSDGSAYQGYFEQDKKAGHCRSIYADGSVFDGVLVEGKREGFGFLINKEGDMYKGEFKNDIYSGKGNSSITQANFNSNLEITTLENSLMGNSMAKESSIQEQRKAATRVNL